MSKALGKAMAWERNGRVAPKRDEKKTEQARAMTRENFSNRAMRLFAIK